MTQSIIPQQFVAKWSAIQQKETAVPQFHFNDICALTGHATPIAYDPTGQNFSFEAQTFKPDAHELAQSTAWLNPPPPPMDVVDVAYQKMLKSRTLTNLYNGLVTYRETRAQGRLWDGDQIAKDTRKSVTRAQIQELDDIHRTLDTAVLDAYVCSHNLTGDQILERLLALNLERAAAQEKEWPKNFP